MTARIERYHGLLIVLHWVMAVAVISMIALGLTMSDGGLDKALRVTLYQWHKSLGVLLLIALFFRIGLRLLTTVPPLPSTLPPIERAAAKLGHFLLYAVLIVMVGSGWVMVSSSAYGLPTIVFGWFEWPHIPGIAGNKAVRHLSGEIHEVVAYALIVLLLGHVAAVIKHAIKEKTNLLKRMWFYTHPK